MVESLSFPKTTSFNLSFNVRKKIGNFRHCETTLEGGYKGSWGFFRGLIVVTLVSWTNLCLGLKPVGPFLQGEIGPFVTVIRITNTKFYFRHCETPPGGSKIIPSDVSHQVHELSIYEWKPYGHSLRSYWAKCVKWLSQWLSHQN